MIIRIGRDDSNVFAGIKPARVDKSTAAICCITRRRPNMLRELLISWAKLKIPEGVRPLFIVVENDELAPSENVTVQARPDFAAGELIYAVEPEVGIPHARNTAIRVALEKGADVIAFVDDDETVSNGWFMHLYDSYRQSGAQLIGGPVRAIIPAAPQNMYRRVIQRGIRDRYDRTERKAAARLTKGQLHLVTILTNNWLADAKLFTLHGLGFDRSLRYSGGSDTKFFRDAVAKGVSTGWSPQAVVFETIPAERTSLAYQFRRGMEQSKTSIRAKIHDKGRIRILPILITSVVLRSVGTGLLLAAVPFSGGRSLVAFCRSCGWLVGRLAGFLGRRSTLYQRVTGN